MQLNTIKIDKQGMIEDTENDIEDYEIAIQDLSRLIDDVSNKSIIEYVENAIKEFKEEKEKLEDRKRELEYE